MEYIIRKGEERDVPALLAIYNYEVKNGVATWDLNERTLEEWMEWYHEHNVENHPLYVADLNGTAIGYATLSAYRAKEAYSITTELSVYVDAKHRGMGVAAALLETVLADARADERTHLVVSVITSGNDVSTHLHEKFGFSYRGTIEQAGVKFGRLLSIDHYTLIV